MAEYLEIPVAGKKGSVKLVVYPQSSKAQVFEEREPMAGESRWQLVEGCTYTYEFVDEHGRCRYQFELEDHQVEVKPYPRLEEEDGMLKAAEE